MRPWILLAIFVVGMGVSFATGFYFEAGKLADQAVPGSGILPSSQALVYSGENVASSKNSEKSATVTSDAPDITAILKESNPRRRLKALIAYVETLSAEQMPGAMKNLLGKRDPSGQALLLLIDRWMEVDPQGAMDELKNSKDASETRALANGIFRALSQAQPAEAIEQARQLPAGPKQKGGPHGRDPSAR